MIELPVKYTNNMKELLGSEYDSYIESFKNSRLYGLRVNTLKISVEDFINICPFEIKPIPWVDNGFYYDESVKPAKHPYYHAGLYYIQEPSAMIPANIMPIKPDDKVLDMCAAPGGKSTELGAKLNKSGVLITNDISNSRAKALLKNIELAGIPNSLVLSENPEKLKEYYPQYFDKILIDAPCSGEGMFRKDSKLIKSWEENGPQYYHEIQKEILLHGYDMLKPGGIMVYSTCTFSTLEDEMSLKYLMDIHPDMNICKLDTYKDFSQGFNFDTDERIYNLENTIRVWPHKLAGEGHFVAVLKKEEHSEANNKALMTDLKTYSGTEKLTGKEKAPKELIAFFEAFDNNYNIEELYIKDDRVYILNGAEVMRGLRILRCGLYLGDIKKNRFEPSQALAMVLDINKYPLVLNLEPEDVRVVKYLKGETIEAKECEISYNKKGWCLVGVNGFSLGWAKCSNGLLKNKYNTGWRWQ